MVIKSLISDRHTSIAKWMREDCVTKCNDLGKPVVQHFFDIWHIVKSKQNNQTTKKLKQKLLTEIDGMLQKGMSTDRVSSTIAKKDKPRVKLSVAQSD